MHLVLQIIIGTLLSATAVVTGMILFGPCEYSKQEHIAFWTVEEEK